MAELRKLSVTNSEGRRFTVVLVKQGEPLLSGLTQAHTRKWHDDAIDSPTLEIFDATYEDKPFYAKEQLGQFVSSYYLSTLMERTGPPQGIDLHGGEPVWFLTAENLTAILNWAAAQ